MSHDGRPEPHPVSLEVALRSATPEDLPGLVAVWRNAVEGSHDFVARADLAEIESRLLREYLPSVEITVATIDGVPVGFSGIVGDDVAMLFVAADHQGSGVGSALLAHARTGRTRLTLDVNEPNEPAVAFYRRQGFRVVGRSERDGEGRPYPLLHLERSAPTRDDGSTDGHPGRLPAG